MNKIIGVMFFVFLSTLAFSQNYKDVVYLKNGSIIRGLIMEQIPGKTIKIESSGNILVYSMDEVEKIVKEEVKGKSSSLRGVSGLKKGYQGTVETGPALGNWENGISAVLKFNFINSFRFNPFFSLGLGAGTRLYSNVETLLLPVYADLRINFIDKRISPYMATGLGNSFYAKDFGSAGIFVNEAVGVSINFFDKSSLNVGFNIELQNAIFNNYDYYSGYPNTVRKNYTSVGFIVGFSF